MPIYRLISMSALLLLLHPPLTYAQAGGSGPFTVATERYEIVAGSEEALHEAQRDLDFAVAQWRRYFGVDPIKIAVHVADSASAVVMVSTRGYRERDIPVLPWLSSRAMAALRQGGGAAPPARALSHEACHMFLVGHVQQRRGQRVTGSPRPVAGMSHYGHPDVPDWFDEAVATLCEPAEMQADRVEGMARLAAEAIPLAELFDMHHPLSGGTASQGPVVPSATSAAAAGEGRMTMMVTRSSASIAPEIWERAVLFYSQALSVSRYFAREEGDLVVGRIADAYAAGQPLRGVLAGASKLGADYDVLFTRWQEWLREDGGR